MRRTTLAALAATSLLLAGLAGCGDDPQPKFAKSAPPTPSVAVSSPPTPTPTTPTPPQMPAAAKKHTIAGAKAFARYLVNVLDYVSVTIDPAPLASIAGDQCGACQAIINDQRRLVKRGAAATGGRESLTRMGVVRLISGTTASPMRARLSIRHTSQTVTYRKGKPDTYAAGTTRYEFTFNPIDTGWEVASWTVLN